MNNRQIAATQRPRDAKGHFVKKHHKADMNITPDAHLKHVKTFSLIPNLPSHLYRNLDEALRDSPSNAKAMRRDPFVLEALFARQFATAELRWSLVPEDKGDPIQQYAVQELTKIIEDIPHFVEMKRNLLEALWYGKYSVVMDYGFKWNQEGKRRMIVNGWMPLMGDKLVFDYDTDEVGYRINPAWITGLREVRWSTEGTVEMFSGVDRETVIIHSHFIADGDYHEPDVAVAVKGLGLRSQIYWAWYNRQELMGWLFNALERYQTGLVIGYFEAGNPQSEAAVRDALEQQQQNNIILFPRPIGTENQGAGLEIVNPNNESSLNAFRDLIDSYFNKQIHDIIFPVSEDAGKSGDAEQYLAEKVSRIVKYDAANLEDTLSDQLVKILLTHNFPNANFELKMKLHVDKIDPTNFLESAQRFFEMGGSVEESQLRSILGLSEPSEDDAVLEKSDTLEEDQTMRKPIMGTQEMVESL